MKKYYVYIITNKPNGTLYIGMTNDIIRRIYGHKNKVIRGFTKRYDLKILVYYEVFGYVHDAIRREKQLKKWNRSWKLKLIETDNPKWLELSLHFTGLNDFL